MSSVRRRVLLALGGLAAAPLLGWTGYAAVTWLRFGGAASGGVADGAIGRFMPRYDIDEIHRTRVSAPASVTFDAARSMRLEQSPVIHAIFRGRELMLGSSRTEQANPPAFVDELLSIGWGLLDEEPGRRMTFGAVTQPWKADVVFRALPSDAFAAFDSAGYVKIVVAIAADSLGPASSEFRTETRALATDPESRAKFRRYWAVFSPGILLIRQEALRIVRREAERSAVRVPPTK